MLGLGTEHMYYYYSSAVDMRKGFNGLCGVVQEHMSHHKGANIVYAFINKSKDKMKLLHWRVGGYVIYYKRLEKGVFELPKYDIKEGLIVLTYTEMIMVMDGISIVNAHKKKRY
jgi:transposase